MFKRIILLILTLLTYAVSIHSQEENKSELNNNQKAIEFDIGLGISGIFTFYYPSSALNNIVRSIKIGKYQYIDRNYTYNIIKCGIGGEVFLPISLYNKYDYRNDNYYNVSNYAINLGVQMRWKGCLFKSY